MKDVLCALGCLGAMCSYNAPLGQPSCANGYLLNQVIRGQWNFSDVLITTDCGAVIDMRGAPAHGSSDAVVAAWALNNGTDLEMGSMCLLNGLLNATRSGFTTEDAITRAARRTLAPLFRAGRFDNMDASEWARFNGSTVGAALHLQIRDEAALQSFVLLKNEKQTLPLQAGKQHIAVLGPQSSGQGLFSDYFGDDICYGLTDRYQNNLHCVHTIAQEVRRQNRGGITTNASGVGISSMNASGIPWALSLGRAADIIVLCLGIDKSIEHEGIDRQDLLLPGLQASFASQVFALNKPVVLVR
eukprot:COSAG05_NODE_737_length_7636_cov_48.020433_6_plen_301_part_00